MSETNPVYHLIVSGDVQGVGYRATVRRHAQQQHVTGTVRNLQDGNVEIIAQGTSDQLEKFFRKIEHEPGGGNVKEIQKNKLNASISYDVFKIEY
ncbi:MAG: acylphosphatase [Parachlamydiales bacterium]